MARDAERLAAQAQRIRELRRFARITGEQAAGEIGVTYRTYQHWEAGDSRISLENLEKLAAYYGTTQDYIEYGVMTRERGQTPDLMENHDPINQIKDQLQQLEQKLDLLLLHATGDVDARAVREALGPLEEEVARQTSKAPQQPANRPA